MTQIEKMVGYVEEVRAMRAKGMLNSEDVGKNLGIDEAYVEFLGDLMRKWTIDTDEQIACRAYQLLYSEEPILIPKETKKEIGEKESIEAFAARTLFTGFLQCRIEWMQDELRRGNYDIEHWTQVGYDMDYAEILKKIIEGNSDKPVEKLAEIAYQKLYVEIKRDRLWRCAEADLKYIQARARQFEED